MPRQAVYDLVGMDVIVNVDMLAMFYGLVTFSFFLRYAWAGVHGLTV